MKSFMKLSILTFMCVLPFSEVHARSRVNYCRTRRLYKSVLDLQDNSLNGTFNALWKMYNTDGQVDERRTSDRTTYYKNSKEISRTVDKTGKCITSKFNRCNAEIKFGTDEAGNLVRILHSYKWNGKKYMNWYCQVCESGQECKNVLYQSTDRNKSGAVFEPEAGRRDCERGHTGIRAKYACEFK